MAATRRVDIKLVFDTDELSVDVEVVAGALREDNGLETAIILSLFCNRRATPDELERFGGEDPGGWWGDALSEIEGDEYGSKLWLLTREKETPETLERAREYAQVALAWMIEDGIAKAVTVEASWKERGVLSLVIDVERPNLPSERFAFVWEL